MNQKTGCVTVLLAGLSFVLTAVGCSTPSLNPLYGDDLAEVVTDDRVVGSWAEADGHGNEKGPRYVVTRVGEEKDEKRPKEYVLRIREKGELGAGESGGKTADFELRLVRLGAQDYVDLFPTNSERNRLGERYGLGVVPVHIIMPVMIGEQTVTARPLPKDKVTRFLEASPKVTTHCMQGDMPILTGTSKQVQEFFRRVVQGEDVFGEPIELRRVEAVAEPAKPAEEPRAPADKPVRRRSR